LKREGKTRSQKQELKENLKREGRTRSQKQELKENLKREGRTRSQKQEGKSGSHDKALETERQKQEPKVRM
jgi:hypothetical protein